MIRPDRGHLGRQHVSTARYRSQYLPCLITKSTAYFMNALGYAVITDRNVSPDSRMNGVAIEQPRGIRHQ